MTKQLSRSERSGINDEAFCMYYFEHVIGRFAINDIDKESIFTIPLKMQPKIVNKILEISFPLWLHQLISEIDIYESAIQTSRLINVLMDFAHKYVGLPEPEEGTGNPMQPFPSSLVLTDKKEIYNIIIRARQVWLDKYFIHQRT